MLADRIRVTITIAVAGSLGASLVAAKTLATDESTPSAPTLVVPAAKEPIDVNVTFQQRRHTGLVLDSRVIERTRMLLGEHHARVGYTCYLPAPRASFQREIDFDLSLEEARARVLEEQRVSR